MTVQERLRQLAAALPSAESAVTFTRADLLALIDGEAESRALSLSDLTVQEVASEVKRSPSTVRTWLISGALRGYKLNRRDWRVPRTALREYLAAPAPESPPPAADVDLGAWRKIREERR